MEKEIWKDIPEYEGLYQISKTGKIKSLKKLVEYSNRSGFKKEKILKGGIDRGYTFVILSKDGKVKNFKIHQLMAITFLNHKPNGYKVVVDHIDNNTLNNNLENLQLITQRENTSKDKNNTTSKYSGVHKNKKNKWIAQIQSQDICSGNIPKGISL